MSSTNKIVIPFNSTFSVDAFFSVLLRSRLVVFQRKETPLVDFSAGRKVSDDGVWHAFCLSRWGSGSRIFGRHASTQLVLSSGPEYKLGTLWALTLCPVPQHLLLWLDTRDTRAESSQDFRIGGPVLGVWLLTFKKHLKSLILPGEVKEPLNVFIELWLCCGYGILVSTTCLP